MFVISCNNNSFIPQILKVVNPLGKKARLSWSHRICNTKGLRFLNLRGQAPLIQSFQRYLTDKSPTHGRGTASVFQFGARSS